MSSVPSAPRRLPQHGTVAGYNAGCDCRPCKRARANYSTARYQAKRRAQREQQLARRDLVIDAVRQYRQAGWTPFPLPAASKFPPPRGITGASGRPVTDADYADWVDQWANVGLVLPDGVIGLDLDLYKPGDAVADGLPPTIRSTSRDDGSGIYMYKVPPGTKLKGTIEGLGEVVQRTHRYVVAPPSLHPEGRVYKWLNDDDEEAGIPSIDSLSWLPEIWLRRLQDRPASRRSGKGFKGGRGGLVRHPPEGPHDACGAYDAAGERARAGAPLGLWGGSLRRDGERDQQTRRPGCTAAPWRRTGHR